MRSVGDINVTVNAGTIEATGSNVAALDADKNVTVTNNTGTIRANGGGSHAISSLANVTITNNTGTIQATGALGSAVSAIGLATVTNSGSITGSVTGIGAAALNVTNSFGGTISGGSFYGVNGSGSVTNAGTISGGTASVKFTGNTGTNTLTSQTGSTLIGDAVGSIAGATNKLILQGQGGASSNFKSFDTLDVNASGVWNLGAIGGTSTIGVTAINSGTLDVNSTLISQVTVNSGGALAGLGIVSGDVAVASGGAVAPGAAFPFKTLNISGNVNFQSGSLYRVNVNAAGANDSLAVGGTATLTGGAVRVLATGTFAPSTSTKYTILTAAAGGLGGTNVFSGVTSNLAFLTPTLTYDPNNVFLTLATITGAAFPTKAAPGAMTTSRDLTFWALGLGGWGHADSDGNAASLTSRFGGFLSGADARFGDTLRAGLVAGYTRTDLNVDARASSAGIDSAQFGAYAGGRVGAFNVRGGASYSYDSIDTSRSIAFTGFSDQTHARFHGNVGQVFGEVGYGMAFNQVAIEPLAGLAYVHVRDGSFQESGGAAALNGASTRENIGYSSLGLRAATAVPLANGTVLVPRGSVQWQYAFGDVNPATALAFQGTGTGFTVAGLPIARNTALVEGGFDWRFSPQAKLGATYQGELAAHAQAHAFKGTFNWNF